MFGENDADGGMLRGELLAQLRGLGFEARFFEHLPVKALAGLLKSTLQLGARQRKVAAVVRQQVAALRRGAEVVVPDEGEATEAALFYERHRAAFQSAGSTIKSRRDFVRTFVHSGCRTFAEFTGRTAV